MSDAGVPRRAAVIAVGSELLTPFRTDTNSLFITSTVNAVGVQVVFKAVVGDDPAELKSMLTVALGRADLVVVCGGLGPTDDDVTRDVVAQLLGRPLYERPEIAARIKERFIARGLDMPDINVRQARVPDGADVLENPNGTAPGLWMDCQFGGAAKLVVLLPGPPRELEPMLIAATARLATRSGGAHLVRRVVRLTGRSESHAEVALQPLYAEWQRWKIPVSATILAALGQIELHLSAAGFDQSELDHVIERAVGEAHSVLGKDVYSIDGRPMEAVVGDLLAARGWRICVGESCTGGLVTARLTSVPGSSRYVDRGVVTYSNAAKTDLLGVSALLIEQHGAVSEEVARAMARGARERTGADVGIGVTGIAGPGGGTPEKPVGTVAVAVTAPDGERVRTLRFMGERELVRFQASQAALDTLRRLLTP